MRKLLFIIATFICVHSQAQLIADPTIEQVRFTDLSGNAIDDTMPVGYIAQLNIPIRNLSFTTGIPQGSCKIKIGLGTKIILDPSFNIALASTSEYFDWTAAFVSGQVQLTGELRVPLPPAYSGVARFNVVGNVLEYSTITANFLITNHNTQVILSDEDPANNSSFRLYKIVAFEPIPVSFSSIQVTRKDCSAEIVFKTENELNVRQYDIEVSSNGRFFTKAGTINATNSLIYKYNSPVTGSSVMYVRIKSIDFNGDYQYSTIKTLSGTCENKPVLTVYPNPATAPEDITIKATQGLLNGNYEVVLYDITGRKISSGKYIFNNQQQFIYPFSRLAAGQYLLTVINTSDATATAVLKVQKK